MGLGKTGFSLRASDIELTLEGRRILKNINFELKPCSFVALLGPNGSGKTSFLKVLCGLREPDHGTVEIPHTTEKRGKITYVGSSLRVDFPIQAKDLVLMGRLSHQRAWFSRQSKHDCARAEEAMVLTDCLQFATRDFNSLSEGEQQRVNLARALAQETSVLLLDEVLSKMDLNYQELLCRRLKALSAAGRAILWVSHDFNLASEFADEICFFKDGTILQYGPVQEIFSQKVIDSLYPHCGIRVEKSAYSQRPKIFFSA